MELEDIRPDRVVIFGQVVTRPSRMSPSQWMAYWEKLRKGEP
jgi:hypothetical protein